jgi:Rieske Fe-S protein
MTSTGHEPVDPRIDSERREGLTGTVGASLYDGSLDDTEAVTTPPDGRPLDEQPAWRQDFPIDWPQEHYVERRDFMKFIVLTSLAFTVGQFWIVVENWRRGHRREASLVELGSVDDVPVGSARTFAFPTEHDPCVLIRPDDRTLLAYSQKCTHLSCAVVPDVDGGVLRCPCHEGLFDLRSGAPVAGPPQRPLARVRLEVRDGRIFAAGVEERTV